MMRYNQLKLCTALLLTLSLTGLKAQESLNAAGGNASGSGGSATYSIGQVVYTTNSDTSNSVAEGVQQPFEISEVTGLETAKGINLTTLAYPNPTSDYLTLEVRDFNFSELTFQLYDMSGKILQTGKITESLTSIYMLNLVPSTYFIKVMQNNIEVKTFKIIKTN